MSFHIDQDESEENKVKKLDNNNGKVNTNLENNNGQILSIEIINIMNLKFLMKILEKTMNLLKLMKLKMIVN